MAIDAFLRCCLCEQLVVEPFTASSCRHTFCRRCLGDLEKHTTCPKCDRKISPKELHPDICLEELVDAMQAAEKEQKRKEKLLAMPVDPKKPDLISLVLEFFPIPCSVEFHSDDDYEAPDPDVPSTSAASEPPKKKKKRVTRNHQLPRLCSQIFRRFYRCPSHTKLRTLQKLLEAKLVGAENSTIHFVHNKENKELNLDSTLREIAIQTGWLGTRPFRLMFTLMENKDRPPQLDPEPMPCLQPEAPQEMPPPAVPVPPAPAPRLVPPTPVTTVAPTVTVSTPQFTAPRPGPPAAKRRRTSDNHKVSPPSLNMIVQQPQQGTPQRILLAQTPSGLQKMSPQFLQHHQLRFQNMILPQQQVITSSSQPQFRLPVAAHTAFHQNIVRAQAPRLNVQAVTPIRPTPVLAEAKPLVSAPSAAPSVEKPAEPSREPTKPPEIQPFKHALSVQPILNKNISAVKPTPPPVPVKAAPSLMLKALTAQAIPLKTNGVMPIIGAQVASTSPPKVSLPEVKPLAAPVPMAPVAPNPAPAPATTNGEMDVGTRAKLSGQPLGRALKDSFKQDSVKSTKTLLEINKQSPDPLKQQVPQLVAPSTL